MGLLWKLYSVKNKRMTDLVCDYAAKDRPHTKHKKHDTKQYSSVAMSAKHSK